MRNRRYGTNHPYGRSLFGSYARGDWVEKLGQNGYYKYQSDFDLLVMSMIENWQEGGKSGKR